MKKLIIIGMMLIASLFFVQSVASSGCFLIGESVDGFNKICYYNCIDGQRAITIGALDFCPLSL